MMTLDSEKVPGSSIVTAFAIVAHNVHNSTKLRWYRLHRYATRHCIPRWHHSFFGLGRLLTNRASTIVGRQLSKALPVNGMSTRHFVRGTATGKQILLAYGTVGLVLARLAIVTAVQGLINAHSTVVTVLKVIASTDTAKATVLAMIRVLVIRHPKIANVAVISAKLDSTANTIVAVVNRERVSVCQSVCKKEICTSGV
jgi:hypothetical protein